jgi:hypothetical protein
MPAVSKAQQRFMGMCAHNPKHANGDCPDKETSREFARTSRKGLPERKTRRKPQVSYPMPKKK